MAVKMEIKLRNNDIEELTKGVSVKELRRLGFTSISKFRDSKVISLVRSVAEESGYHPSQYGMWDISINQINNEFYAVWYRSGTCD